MTTVSEIAARVAEIGVDKIDTKTLETLRDMCRRAGPYGGRLTPKQADYARTLLDRAAIRREQAGRPPVDLMKVVAMFAKAAESLKRPFVNLLANGCEFRISPAGAQSRNAGFLYVKSGETYLGKISPTGAFSASRDASPAILTAIEGFAADPAASALAYGQATGNCSFCARKLEDPVSVELGYGPICARKWNLPHRHTGVGSIRCEEAA